MCANFTENHKSLSLLNSKFLNKTEDPSVQYAGKGCVLRRPKKP